MKSFQLGILFLLFLAWCPLGVAGSATKGMASWYGKKYHGRTTASGATFNMNEMTAAHRTLPFGTQVRVTRVSSGKSVVVTINDRGPFAKNRIIDLSRKAASQLGIIKKGQAMVKIEVLKAAE
ncbi:MAG: septal ring lytic transglycosylase RlpA family protein [Bdellovibrionota bacterium]